MKPCKICNKPQDGGYIICAECAEEVERMNAEIQQFREAAAAEYGIDAQTMLTLAKSQIATAKRNCELRDENENLRNELCLKCGRYRTAHLGACDGCRWKEEK